MGKKTTKTSSTSSPPDWAVGPLTGGLNDILNTVQGNQGNLTSLESGLTGGVLPGIQGQIAQQGQQLQPGYGYIGSTLANNPGNANPSNGFLSGTLNSQFLNANSANPYLTAQANGSYLNSNPYTQKMAQFAGQQAGNAVNSAFSSAGRTGSGDNVTDTARGVDQAANQVLFQNYQNERNLQNQAIGMLGQNYNTASAQQGQNAALLGNNYNTGLGIQSQAAGLLPGYTSSQFAGYQPLLGATQLAGQIPYYGVNSLGNMGSLVGNYGTTSGTQPGGWGTDLLNAAATVGAGFAMHSDRRLKTNIEKVGEASDGLGIYTWNWKAAPDGEKVRGVIADEVEKIRPWAFVKNYQGNGFDGVNYGILGSVA